MNDLADCSKSTRHDGHGIASTDMKGKPVLAATRRSRIVELLRNQRSVQNDHLVAELGVSVETVRRDLEQLDKAGVLVRVRGGAVGKRNSMPVEPPFPARQNLGAEEKQAMGRLAVSLVDDCRTLFVDIGTSAEAVANVLVSTFRGTVVTPSMRVAGILAESRDIEVLVPGGRVRSGDMSIAGPTARSFLEAINPDVAFIGTGGVDVDAGITDFELVEVDIKRVVIDNSDRVFALAHSHKIGIRAPYRVCDLSAVDAIISDTGMPADAREAFAVRDVVVHLA